MGRRSGHTPAQKRDAVLAVLTKRKTISEVCRELAVSEQTFHRWRNQALEGMEAALGDKAETNAREAELARRLAEAERTVGQLALENQLLGKASRRLT
jgi:transposase-like protein